MCVFFSGGVDIKTRIKNSLKVKGSIFPMGVGRYIIGFFRGRCFKVAPIFPRRVPWLTPPLKDPSVKKPTIPQNLTAASPENASPGKTENIYTNHQCFLVGNPFEKMARQIGSFLQIGMIKIQKQWNHHLALVPCVFLFRWCAIFDSHCLYEYFAAMAIAAIAQAKPVQGHRNTVIQLYI